MLLKIAIAAAVVVAAMLVAKETTVLQRTGLLSSCSAVAAQGANETSWQACRAGKLDGRPDLSRKSCTARGIVGEVEYWRCPAGISTELNPE